MSPLIEFAVEVVGEVLSAWLDTPRRKAIALTIVGAMAAMAHAIALSLRLSLPGWLSLALLVTNLICGVGAVGLLVAHRSAGRLYAIAFVLNLLAFALAWRIPC